MSSSSCLSASFSSVFAVVETVVFVVGFADVNDDANVVAMPPLPKSFR